MHKEIKIVFAYFIVFAAVLFGLLNYLQIVQWCDDAHQYAH